MENTVSAPLLSQTLPPAHDRISIFVFVCLSQVTGATLNWHRLEFYAAHMGRESDLSLFR